MVNIEFSIALFHRLLRVKYLTVNVSILVILYFVSNILANTVDPRVRGFSLSR